MVSFGLAGGLDPEVRPGDLLVPAWVMHQGQTFAADPKLGHCFGGLTGHKLLAGSSVIAEAGAKQALHRDTNAHAVDLESGAVAQVAAANQVPFVAVRAICDPVERSLPRAALLALDVRGRIGMLRLLASLTRQPSQVGSLLVLARDAAASRAALKAAVERFRRGDRR